MAEHGWHLRNPSANVFCCDGTAFSRHRWGFGPLSLEKSWRAVSKRQRLYIKKRRGRWAARTADSGWGASQELGFGPLDAPDPPSARFYSRTFPPAACVSDLARTKSKAYNTGTHIYKGRQLLSAHMYLTCSTRARMSGIDTTLLRGATRSDNPPACEVDQTCY
jgi:hypothetical protein